MDGLDFGFPTELSGGQFAAPTPPSFQMPSFDFSGVPNLSADLNFSALAPESGIGRLPQFDVGNMGGGTPPSGAPERSWLDTVSGYAKTVAPIVGLGTTAAQVPLELAQLSQTGRAQKAMESAVSTEQAAAAPAIAAENRLLPAGTEALLTGNLPPELEASVNDQVNQARQTLLQQLESAGIDSATANAMIEQQMQELRTQLTLQYAQGMLGGGQSTGALAGTASGQAGAIAGTTAQANPLMAANQALARLTASP